MKIGIGSSLYRVQRNADLLQGDHSEIPGGWMYQNASHSSYACMTVYKCLHGMGPIYLSEMCRPSSSEAGRRHLRSVNRGQLVVPRYRLTTAGRRAFSCAGPSAWNSLPEYLTVDTLTLDNFKRSLKCFLFARY